jgi:predicted PurR-regulated permease PerM
LVLLGFFGTVAGTIGLLVNPVSDQIQAFQEDLPALIDSANASLADVQRELDERDIGLQIAVRGETALESLSSNFVEGSGDVLTFAREIVTLFIERVSPSS